MALMKRMRLLWDRKRELAVGYGISDRMLRHMDALLEDEERFVTERDSYLEDMKKAMEWVDHEIHFHATRDAGRHAAYREYKQRLLGDFVRFQIQNEKKLKEPRAVGYLWFVATSGQSAPDLVGELMTGLPDLLHCMIGLKEVNRASRNRKPEPLARASMDVIHRLVDGVYAPMLKKLFELTMRQGGKTPSSSTMAPGWYADECKRRWAGMAIEDFVGQGGDWVFVRNAAAHEGPRMRFDPSSESLTMTDPGKGAKPAETRHYTTEQTYALMMGLVERVRAMWLVFHKCSGEMAAYQAAWGISISMEAGEQDEVDDASRTAR
jgi:hypothetical protein